jgi:aspartate aminotransferase
VWSSLAAPMQHAATYVLDEPAALRFRMATSLLHGRTDDERWAALAAADPASLPWIRSALDRLGQTLRALGGVSAPR